LNPNWIVTLQYDRANRELPHPLSGSDVQAISLMQGGLMVATIANDEAGRRTARLICVRGREWESVLTEDLPSPTAGFTAFVAWIDTHGTRRLAIALGNKLLQGVGCQSLEVVDAPVPLGAIHAHDGRLVAAPRAAGQPLALVMDEAGRWSSAVDSGMTTSPRRYISAFASHGGRLYAAVADHAAGFEIWRSTAPGRHSHLAWETVVERGAYRYSLNSSVPNMVSFGGRLLLGTTCLEPTSIDDLPSAPEIIQLHADGTWELVVGQPRFSPVGLKVPLSALTAGFGVMKGAASILLREHRDQLFALAQPVGDGHAQLWSSMDAQVWGRVDTPGLARLRRVEVMESTPRGLLLGGSAATRTVPLIRIE
jgi:hypothetical protein